MNESNNERASEPSSNNKKKFISFITEGESTDLTFKEAIINNLIVGLVALAVYFPVELQGFTLFNSHYYFHVLLSVICFVLWPMIYLTYFYVKTKKGKYFFLTTKKGLKPKKVISSLLQGIAMHAGIFYPWIILAQRYNPGVIKLHYFMSKPSDWVVQIVFFALNVLMFEFYSKAFIQIQFSEAKGSLILFNGKLKVKGGKILGFILQNVAWIGGHVQEFLWLQDYIGVVNAIFFILISGILTGLTVLETENIFGVSLGHVLLNVFVLVTYA